MLDKNFNPDKELHQLLKIHIQDTDIIKCLNSFQRRTYTTKQFAYYEIYKLVKDLPGDIIECGIFKGDSLLTLARLVETFSTGDRTKMIWGFDHFQGLINRNEKDGYNESLSNWNPNTFKETIFKLIDLFNKDTFFPKKPRIQLIDGDIKQTAFEFVTNNPGVRISMLHLDMDLYEPTLAALEAFYPLVVKGGVVILDEVCIKEWPGETSALEDYFQDKIPQLQKFSWCSAPGGFFIK